MNNTKETIGPRGTVHGFRPLIGEERWHRDDFEAGMLEGGWRPLMLNEVRQKGDQADTTIGWQNSNFGYQTMESVCRCRAKRPLPPPQVETFEAHGHVWYRHVPGDACPVEPGTLVYWLSRGCKRPCKVASKVGNLLWKECGGASIIGYRFPDFPAVHTPLQQQQPVEKTEQSFQHEQPEVQQQFRTKKRLLDMYHGWCDVAPDSVAECIADVAKVLYPTDAERCDAAFQKWWGNDSDHDMHPFEAKAAWQAAWNAAKQEKP